MKTGRKTIAWKGIARPFEDGICTGQGRVGDCPIALAQHRQHEKVPGDRSPLAQTSRKRFRRESQGAVEAEMSASEFIPFGMYLGRGGAPPSSMGGRPEKPAPRKPGMFGGRTAATWNFWKQAAKFLASGFERNKRPRGGQGRSGHRGREVPPTRENSTLGQVSGGPPRAIRTIPYADGGGARSFGIPALRAALGEGPRNAEEGDSLRYEATGLLAVVTRRSFSKDPACIASANGHRARPKGERPQRAGGRSLCTSGRTVPCAGWDCKVPHRDHTEYRRKGLIRGG